jgi:hypothetical protein
VNSHGRLHDLFAQRSFAKLVVALLSLLTLASTQAQTVADISHGITNTLIDANVEILLSNAGEPGDPSSYRSRTVVLYKPHLAAAGTARAV